MLDEEFNAKLGDFGLVWMVEHRDKLATTMVAGTFGYIAPEVASTGKFTTKTDVFAFGAAVLEVVCGRLAYSQHLPEQEVLLLDWVLSSLEKGELINVVDHGLNGQFEAEKVEMVLRMDLLCSHPNPDDRPQMQQVLEILAGSVLAPSVPPSKPAQRELLHRMGSSFLTFSSASRAATEWE